MGSPSLLQRIFLTQESNWGFLHCRWILYQLSFKGSPNIIMNTFNSCIFQFSVEPFPPYYSGHLHFKRTITLGELHIKSTNTGKHDWPNIIFFTLLKYNWQIKMVHLESVQLDVLINILFSFFLVVRTLRIHPVSKSQVFITILLTIITCSTLDLLILVIFHHWNIVPFVISLPLFLRTINYKLPSPSFV